jgi:hypothetical protein
MPCPSPAECIATYTISPPVLPCPYKGVGTIPTSKNGHGPAGLKGDVFRECGHTPYACSDSVLLVIVLLSSYAGGRIGKRKYLPPARVAAEKISLYSLRFL